MQNIDAQELIHKIHEGSIHLVDVRSADEFESAHIPGSVNVAMTDLPALAKLLPRDESIYLVCQSGKRSSQACQNLESSGMSNIVSLRDGINGYVKAGGKTVSLTGTIPLMRQVQITAGFLVLLGVVLALFLHPGFIYLSAFVGAGLMFAGISGYCGMALLLQRLPWNKSGLSCQIPKRD